MRTTSKPARFRKPVGASPRKETKRRRPSRLFEWTDSTRDDLRAFATCRGRLWRIVQDLTNGSYRAEMHIPTTGAATRWPGFASPDKAKDWCEVVAESLGNARRPDAGMHGEA